MSQPNPPMQSNTLGKASLVLGILGSFFVFVIGLCAGVGREQGWLQHVGAILFVLGASAAFLGFLGAILGFLGLFGANRSRIVAIAGLLLGTLAIILFLAIVQAGQKP